MPTPALNAMRENRDLSVQLVKYILLAIVYIHDALISPAGYVSRQRCFPTHGPWPNRVWLEISPRCTPISSILVYLRPVPGVEEASGLDHE